MTPHVHGTDEVTLHISVDISNVSHTVKSGGLSQPVISQTKNEADIRVKDGEVSLLGGLMQTQDTNIISGIPGLVNIPILGKYLFGNTSQGQARDELMIALIPHIVRRPDITGLDLRGVAAGTGSDSEAELRAAEGRAGRGGSRLRPRPPAAAPATATRRRRARLWRSVRPRCRRS